MASSGFGADIEFLEPIWPQLPQACAAYVVPQVSGVAGSHSQRRQVRPNAVGLQARSCHASLVVLSP